MMTLGIMGWFHAICSCRVHYRSITSYGPDERRYLTIFTARPNASPERLASGDSMNFAIFKASFVHAYGSHGGDQQAICVH